jgi:hypothetical protein
MLFGPDQRPGPILPRELSADFVSPVMTGNPVSEIICVTNVKAPVRVLENINAKHSTVAPEVGFEPTTNRLTADRSTTELLWIAMRSIERR